MSPFGATSGSVALGLHTYKEAGLGTVGVFEKIRPKLSSQSLVKNRLWCISSGTSPFTPKYMSTAEGPGVFFCQYDSG